MFLVASFEDNVLNMIHHYGENREKAELAFLATVREKVSNWDEYTHSDVEAILDLGFEGYGCGVINFIDTSGWEDMDILDHIEENFGKK